MSTAGPTIGAVTVMACDGPTERLASWAISALSEAAAGRGRQN